VVRSGVDRHQRVETVFCAAFGLAEDRDTGVRGGVADLFGLLRLIDAGSGTSDLDPHGGHKLLVGYATSQGRGRIKRYIYDRLTDLEARIVYTFLQDHPERLQPFLDAIPGSFVTMASVVGTAVGSVCQAVGNMVDAAVEDSRALKMARDLIEEQLAIIEPISAQEALRRLTTLFPRESAGGGACAGAGAGFSRAKKYIDEKLTDREARIVYSFLLDHPERLQPFLDTIPSPVKPTVISSAGTASVRAGALGAVSALFPVVGLGLGASKLFGAKKPVDLDVDKAVDDSGALKMARDILEEAEGGAGFGDCDCAGTGGGRRCDILCRLQKHMYGYTPLCKALRNASTAFQSRIGPGRKCLLVISDGDATDGDAVATLTQLRYEVGAVDVVTLFLTAEPIPNTRTLYDAPGAWTEGERVLFAMSSVFKCTEAPVSTLRAAGWRVPPSGECRLFARVNSAEALDEFCRLLMSNQFGYTDTLLSVVGRVSLALYITGDSGPVRTFVPGDQGRHSPTCYAFAAGAVLHLAMARVVRRTGDLPSYSDVVESILSEFPVSVPVTDRYPVLEWGCTRYRLRFREVSELQAREALVALRPVLMVFSLSTAGWDKLEDTFFTDKPRATVLTSVDMGAALAQDCSQCHAVVVTACDASSLTIMNSRGQLWGDGGFFRVAGGDVLSCRGRPPRFFDVEPVFSEEEKTRFREEAAANVAAAARTVPSILEELCECPLCGTASKIRDFTGDVFLATCPVLTCRQQFQPEVGHLAVALYCQRQRDDPRGVPEGPMRPGGGGLGGAKK
jgi:hypothetical protein